jgi:hypothetical protein
VLVSSPFSNGHISALDPSNQPGNQPEFTNLSSSDRLLLSSDRQMILRRISGVIRQEEFRYLPRIEPAGSELQLKCTCNYYLAQRVGFLLYKMMQRNSMLNECIHAWFILSKTQRYWCRLT